MAKEMIAFPETRIGDVVRVIRARIEGRQAEGGSPRPGESLGVPAATSLAVPSAALTSLAKPPHHITTEAP